MKYELKSALTVCLALFLAACTSMSQEAKTVKKQLVNCATAERDIKILENEKASVTKGQFRAWFLV